MVIDLLNLRRQLRRLPLVSVTGTSQPCRWYLNSAGMPALVAPLPRSVGPMELTFPIGDLLTSWKVLQCEHGTTMDTDERDRRYAAAFDSESVCLPLRVEHCMIERLATDSIESQAIDYAALQLGNPFAGAVETRMVDHMNVDHVDAMRAYCELLGVAADQYSPLMLGIDADGFDILLNGRLVRVDFDAPCMTPMEARKALVDLAARGRGLGITQASQERISDV